MSNTIRLSEHFHSVQGEGNTAGRPAVFLRFAGCNLMCGGRGTEKDGQLHDGATWRCDTIEVWLHGQPYSAAQLTNLLFDSYNPMLSAGDMLVLTGGEPMLHKDFLYKWVQAVHQVYPGVRIEVETNGTLMPTKLQNLVEQFNVSPKLGNSGMERGKRLTKALPYYAELARTQDKCIFKFVLTSRADMREILHIVDYYGLPERAVWLMPGCESRQQLIELSPKVAEMAKRYNFNFSPRLQLLLWDKATGV